MAVEAWVIMSEGGALWAGNSEVSRWTRNLANANLYRSEELAEKNMLVMDLRDAVPVRIGVIREDYN